MKLWNATKHIELVKYYHSYEWDKPNYTTFYTRVLVQWLSMEEAMNYQKTYERKTEVDDNWRVCAKCGEYKLRSEYHRYRQWVNHRTSQCAICRNEAKKTYRQKTNNSKDIEYRTKKRKLNEWDMIALEKPILHDWILREDRYKIIGYRYKKWYIGQSTLTGATRYISLWDNPKSAKIYRLIEWINL